MAEAGTVSEYWPVAGLTMALMVGSAGEPISYGRAHFLIMVIGNEFEPNERKRKGNKPMRYSTSTQS